jgi:hypothetical protein
VNSLDAWDAENQTLLRRFWRNTRMLPSTITRRCRTTPYADSPVSMRKYALQPLGIPPNIVMKWTGHSDYSSMKPYIDIVDDIKATSMTKFNDLLEKND